MESENDDTQIIIQQSNNTILNETNSIENVQHNTEKAIAAEKKRKLIFLEPAILLIFFAMNLSGMKTFKLFQIHNKSKINSI